MQPIMLALSTFRQSDSAVELAIGMARKSKRLIVVYVVDANLARYLIGLEITPGLKEKCEEELLKEHKEKTSEIKKKLPEKQKIYDEAKSKYEQIKNARYFSQINDGEVYTRAKDTMFQMDKTLDTLEIELAGIHEKLSSIEKYRRIKHAEDNKRFSTETLDKLDQMYIEQMIELKSVRVRQKAALGIRKREKKFLDLFSQCMELENEVISLNDQLGNHERNLRQAETRLATPTPEMQPLKIYQNKVIIYPVKPLVR